MSRGDRGEKTSPDIQAFMEVRNFLKEIGDREPTAEELREMKPSLERLYRKLMRLRARSPRLRKIDLSDRVWKLLQRVGIKPQPSSRRGFGRAASFL